MLLFSRAFLKHGSEKDWHCRRALPSDKTGIRQDLQKGRQGKGAKTVTTDDLTGVGQMFSAQLAESRLNLVLVVDLHNSVDLINHRGVLSTVRRAQLGRLLWDTKPLSVCIFNATLQSCDSIDSTTPVLKASLNIASSAEHSI